LYSLQPPVAYLIHPKPLAAREEYHVVISKNIRVNRMAGRYVEVMWKYAKKGCVAVRGARQAGIVITL
jgi:hypothetical protein